MLIDLPASGYSYLSWRTKDPLSTYASTMNRKTADCQEDIWPVGNDSLANLITSISQDVATSCLTTAHTSPGSIDTMSGKVIIAAAAV